MVQPLTCALSVAALLHKLTGQSAEHHTNPYLSSLVTVTDQWLVQAAMASHLAQWLLCCSPGMDTSEGASSSSSAEESDQSSPELAVGHTIQELWLQLRRLVCAASK